MRADTVPTPEGAEETVPAHPVLPQRSQKERPVYWALVGQSNSWCEDLGKRLMGLLRTRVYTVSHI